MYYNNSNINQNDCLVVYINDYITETTKIININNLKVINTKISIENNREIIISALYRSHDFTKMDLLLNIKKLILHNKKQKNNLIIGDFNFYISNHDTINQEFLHILLENGYCPGFSNITRPSDKTCNSATCINNIFIKLDKITQETFTPRIPLTDLFPLFMSINKIRTTPNISTINLINYNKLRTAAVSINWNELTQINDPNMALNNLIDKIKICLSKEKYNKKTNKTNNMKPRKGWITQAIIKSCFPKEKLYKLWKGEPNNTRKKEEYKKFTNILKNIINKAKESYDKKQIEYSMKTVRVYGM